MSAKTAHYPSLRETFRRLFVTARSDRGHGRRKLPSGNLREHDGRSTEFKENHPPLEQPARELDRRSHGNAEDQNDGDKLCDTCRTAVFSTLPVGSLATLDFEGDDDDVEDIWQDHHMNRVSFERSRAELCCLCCSISDSQPGSEIKTGFRWFVEGEQYDLQICRYYPYLTEEHTDRLTVDYTVAELCTQAREQTMQFAKESQLAPNTGEMCVAKLAKFWMSNCLEHHDTCPSNTVPEWFPTRLLILSEQEMRLIETSACRPNSPYATLSYSWGKKPFTVLTAENMHEFRSGIKRKDLPQTFQEVMLTADRLGIEYLWIDCYCIVQSSDGTESEEKLREIARMDRVYSNAILNFGASRVTSPLDPCFADREPPRSKTHYVRWQPTSEKPEETYFVQEAILGRRGEFGSYFEEPLYQRAWVMQERLLCPRMLHFGQHEIWWECKASNILCSESMPHSRHVEGSSTHDLFALPDKKDLTDEHWAEIFCMYSKMGLSYPSQDKFLAIAGVAKRMAVVSGDEYVAGMFKANLLYELCWSSNQSDRIPPRRAKQWRAPSWSWASMDHISIGYPAVRVWDSIELASLVDVKIDLEDPRNKYGRLRNAFLKLRGFLFPSTSLFTINSALPDFQFHVDWKLDRFDLDDGNATISSICVYALPLVFEFTGMEGLILEPTILGANPPYRRIGFFRVRGRERDLTPQDMSTLEECFLQFASIVTIV